MDEVSQDFHESGVTKDRETFHPITLKCVFSRFAVATNIQFWLEKIVDPVLWHCPSGKQGLGQLSNPLKIPDSGLMLLVHQKTHIPDDRIVKGLLAVQELDDGNFNHSMLR